MTLKDLFGKKSAKPLSSVTLQNMREDGESHNNVISKIELQKKYFPNVDFSVPENFCFYGSAEKYYTDAINNILEFYPYDGSGYERSDWKLKSSYLDNYVLENMYPRRVGHIKMGNNYSIGSDSNGYYSTSENEYILLKGGPNNNEHLSTDKLSDVFSDANVYDLEYGQNNNLRIGGIDGTTLEFWLKKDTFSTGNESTKQVIFDLWNGNSYGDADYGRFRVEIQPGVSGNENNFVVSFLSGAQGADYVPLSSSITLSDNSWHHYAISVKNRSAITATESTIWVESASEIFPTASPTGDDGVWEIDTNSDIQPLAVPTGNSIWDYSGGEITPAELESSSTQVQFQLFVDGVLKHTVNSGSLVSEITGPMQATIGSLQTTVAGTHGGLGSAKLSASLDDFRFWKKSKTIREIGIDWKTPVNGGTNTDTSTSSSLGFYYKFNEGVYSTSSINGYDSKVLDYSGRTTNGTWVGYSIGARSETSAFEESGVLSAEFKDPIVYINHPAVSSLKTRLQNSGSLYDAQNNSNFYNSLPSWIINEDGGELNNLTQVMASQFDEMYLQIRGITDIKQKQYFSSSLESNSFAQDMLENYGFHTSNLFSNTTLLEDIKNRTEKVVFEKKLKEVKDTIYQNLYNNIVYIFKSKGTEKSLRNVLRSTGVNEDLVKINMYSNNSEYTIGEEYKNKSLAKRYIDFYDTNRFSSTVFQMTSSATSDQVSYISSSADNFDDPITVQGEFVLPRIKKIREVGYFPVPFTQSAMIGFNKAKTDEVGDTTWGTNNTDMTVYCVRQGTDSSNAYFMLTSSYLGVNLTTSYYNGAYDNQRWNISFQVKPKKFPYNSFVSGSSTEYEVQFYGTNYELDYKNNYFSLSQDVDTTKAKQMLKDDKRLFVGARRTNNTGSVLDKTNVLASSVRFWNTSLTTEEMDRHAKDGEIYGTADFNKGYRIADNNILKKDTLLLNWDLSNVTSSNSSGNIIIEDYSSGSAELFQDYGSSPIANKRQHPGYGYGFPATSTAVINREYLNVAKTNLPEVVNGDHLVRVVQNDDALLGVEERPTSHYISIEKSIYSTISEEMINTFSSISELNNLIGAPVDKYRIGYKDLEKARQHFFTNIENDPDIEKYLEYYKWIDNSIVDLIKQFLPISSDLVDSNIDVIESHVLERNKVEHKYPAFEERRISTNAKVKGVGELRYPWSRGHAPVSQLESRNCLWWNQRAEKSHTVISSSVASDRQDLFDAIRDSHLEELNKSALFTADEMVSLNENAKKIDYTKTETKFGTGAYLSIEATSISLEKDCDDVLNPNEKIKYDFRVEKL